MGLVVWYGFWSFKGFYKRALIKFQFFSAIFVIFRFN